MEGARVGGGKGTRHLLIFILKYLFVWLLWVFAACELFSCGVWDLVPQPGMKPGPPALGARSLSHWTLREVHVNF